MPRIQFSDVTPPEKRSIRNVPVPSRRKPPVVVRSQDIEPPKAEPMEKNEVKIEPRKLSSQDISGIKVEKEKSSGAYEYYYPKNQTVPSGPAPKKSKKKLIFGVSTVAIIGIFIVSMMTVFASATVTIVPKSQDLDVGMEFSAAKESEPGTVKYEVIKLSKSKSVPVAATGEESVELKASGKIVIYNDYSSEPQRLIVRTRFESPEGLIYRIPESIVVPGKTGDTPGSIEVEVFADEAGEKYNIKKADFTVPGFKNDAARYKGFYARAATEMTGGFIGKMKTVSESDKSTALEKVNTDAQAELKKELETQVPDGLTLLQNAISYKSKELAPQEDGSSVLVGSEVTAYALMLDTKELSAEIVGEYLASSTEWNNIQAEIVDFSGLAIENLPESLESSGKIDLQIKGRTKVWADIDTSAIDQRLAGAPKSQVAVLMDEFAGISSITSTVRPVWKQSFPQDAFKIKVKTSLEQ